MTKKIFVFCILSIFCISYSFSQEEIIQYGSYIKKSNLKSGTVSSSNNELISLPFFDDFAYPQVYPQNSLWIDNNTFVNNSFGKNAPTIGVASFDALNSSGLLYSTASSSSFIADYMTSQAINLKNYQTPYASDKLYIKSGTYTLLGANYFMYNNSSKSYEPITQGFIFYAGDTLYTFNSTNYIPVLDSIYSKTNNTYTYIEGSYTFTPQIKEYTVSDSLALSFYFQAGGYGDAPEYEDSLVLEFYSPADRQGIFINEISKNSIEIYNATDSIVDLINYYLLPNHIDSILLVQDLTQFKLTSTQINPYSHYVINASNIGLDLFSTSNAYLLNKDSIVIDSITSKKELIDDISYARFPDGATTFSLTANVSIGSCNPLWKRVWSSGNIIDENFNATYIPIINTEYFRKGFRFRFKNYASLSNDNSHARNEDFWNIDLVWLDAQRTRTKINPPDVAFVEPISPLYNTFTAVPMTHFSAINKTDFRMTLESAFTNFDENIRKVSFNFAVKKLHTNQTISFPTYNADIPAFANAIEQDVLNDFNVDFYDFISADVNSYTNGEYEFQYYYTDNDNPLYSQYRWNDTNRVTLLLDNYYSYDDGVPEAGYGLREAPMARVAYKYDILKPDTLKAIDIYFNPTLNASNPIFNLCVWSKDENGFPGELLYYMPGEKVEFGTSIYDLVTYKIKEEGINTGETNGIYIDKTCFIGWQQPYDVLLNVGIDLQSTTNKKLYFNTGFDWEQSVVSGALLMHPVFGNLRGEQTPISQIQTNDIYIYPTICTNSIFIKNNELQECSYKIFNSIGSVCKTGTAIESISTQGLPMGIYLVSLSYTNGNRVTQTILIKN